MNQLHLGYKWSMRISGYFSSLVLIIFFSIWAFLFLGPLSIFFLIFMVIILVEVYARLSYKFWLYEFNNSGFKSERGIIWKRYVSIPYERIQNVEINRGILARLLGFSSVNIQTAGSSMVYGRVGTMSEGHLPAVDINSAEKIRDYLMKKISGKGVKLPQGL